MDCVLLQCRDGDLPEFLARKLELSAVLNGHTGCVNRLAWNQDGSLLASASDDCQVRLKQLLAA
jgi:WD40 repeat protein